MAVEKFDCINLGSNGYSRLHLRGNRVQFPGKTADILSSFYPDYLGKQVYTKHGKWIQLWAKSFLYKEFQVEQKDIKSIDINFTEGEEKDLDMIIGIVRDNKLCNGISFEIRPTDHQYYQIPQYIRGLLYSNFISQARDDIDVHSICYKLSVQNSKIMLESCGRSVNGLSTVVTSFDNIKIDSTRGPVNYYVD